MNNLNNERKPTKPAIQIHSGYQKNDKNVELYLKEIAQYELLNAEQEVQLSKAILHDKCPISHAKLVNHNLRLVVNNAKKWKAAGLHLLDFIQSGNDGLIIAAWKYDYRKGYRFSTYATWWIRQSLQRSVPNDSRLIRYPVHIYNLMRDIDEVQQSNPDLARKDLIAKMVEQKGYSKKKVLSAMANKSDVISSDVPLSDDSHKSLVETFENDHSQFIPGNDLDDEQLKQQVDKMLTCLTDKEQYILKRRMGIDMYDEMTLEEVGIELDITRERVRQIQANAIKKLQSNPDAIALKVFLGNT